MATTTFMKWADWRPRSRRTFASVVFAAQTVLTAPFMLNAPAIAQQAPLPIARNTATVTVTPAVADAGTLREIRVSGNWVNGCAPSTSSAAFQTVGGQSTVTVELRLPQTLVACTQAITPYSQSVTITPSVRGRVRVVVVTDTGQYLGEGSIDVRQPGDDRSRYNVTGLWYDPSTNGSGLTFIHSSTNDNAVFGTWYVYGADGVARWFTIQTTRWTLQGEVLEGDLYETRAAGISCAPLQACPARYSSATIIGRARMAMINANTARIEAISPGGQGGAVLFASNLQRIVF